MAELTHIDETGAARMVDVGDKAVTQRVAVASAVVVMLAETLALLEHGGHKKGDVLAVARVAGIQAAKKCSDLIPLCHPLALTKVAVEFDFLDDGVKVRSLARLTGKTGVEMEALTACSIALLTIYDMSKAMQKDMVISDIRLLSKSGGKSGDWVAE